MTNKEVLAKAIAEIERRIRNLVQTEEEENDLKLNYPEQYGIVQGYRAAVAVLESMQEVSEIKLGDRIRIKGSMTKGDIVTNIYQAGDGNTYFEFMNSDDAIADDRWELVEETASKQSVEEAILLAREEARQEIMQCAVDGEVTLGKSLAIPSLGWVVDKNGLDFGDKVKVIIIKQED